MNETKPTKKMTPFQKILRVLLCLSLLVNFIEFAYIYYKWDSERDYLDLKTVGEIVEFGTYPQTKSDDGDSYKSSETIRWKVIKNGRGQMLLLSERCLDVHEYTSTSSFSWKDSSLRKWLNSEKQNNTSPPEFYGNAFSDAQKEIIVYDGHTQTGVKDKVFILSEAQIRDLVGKDGEEEKRIAKPTEYSLNSLIIQKVQESGLNCGCLWWIRAEETAKEGHYVDYRGRFGYTSKSKVEISGNNGKYDSIPSNKVGVRPAIWVKTKTFPSEDSLQEYILSITSSINLLHKIFVWLAPVITVATGSIGIISRISSTCSNKSKNQDSSKETDRNSEAVTPEVSSSDKT